MKHKKILVAYESRYGSTEKIAQRIGAWLKEQFFDVTVAKVAEITETHDYELIIAAAPVYAGAYSESFEHWIHKHMALWSSKDNCLVSVSLSKAGGSEKAMNDLADVVERFSERTGWQPKQVLHVAGSLWYKKYNFFIRWVMKRISSKSGGATDTSKNHHYTDWDALKEELMHLIHTDKLQPAGEDD